MSIFPKDILIEIFGYLEGKDFCKIKLLNRKWCNIYEDEWIWFKYLEKKYKLTLREFQKLNTNIQKTTKTKINRLRILQENYVYDQRKNVLILSLHKQITQVENAKGIANKFDKVIIVFKLLYSHTGRKLIQEHEKFRKIIFYKFYKIGYDGRNFPEKLQLFKYYWSTHFPYANYFEDLVVYSTILQYLINGVCRE